MSNRAGLPVIFEKVKSVKTDLKREQNQHDKAKHELHKQTARY